MERMGTQGVQFIVQLLLARLLLPEAYGIVGLISIFIAVANVFVQSGFNMALVQKKTVDDLDYSSTFWLTMFVALITYIVLFLSAPRIAHFYGMSQLTSVIRVLAISIFFGAVNSIQIAKLSRELNFKSIFINSVFAMSLSGCVGVALAFKGYEEWALVYQQLSNQVFVTLFMLFTVDWKPALKFSCKRVKGLFRFGSNILASSLLDTIYNNLYGLVIGKLFSASALAFYNRADQFPKVLVSNINGTIASVMLPVMSDKQDDKKCIKELVRKSISMSAFFVFPLLLGLAAVARPLLLLLLGAKWSESILFLQILCVSYVFWPIHIANLQAINAIGRSDIYFKLEIIKKTIGILGMFMSIPFGVIGMVTVQAITSAVSVFINAYPNRKLIDYTLKEQAEDIYKSLLVSLTMSLSIGALNFYIKIQNNLSILLVDIFIGAAVYFMLSLAVKNKVLFWAVEQMRDRRRTL